MTTHTAHRSAGATSDDWALPAEAEGEDSGGLQLGPGADPEIPPALAGVVSAHAARREVSRRPRARAGLPAADRSIRIAAVGDLHATTQADGQFRPSLLRAAAEADLLLLAGDLTNFGLPAEARCLAEELHDLGVPAVATLGNHDHHNGCPDEVAAILADAGVRMLEGTGVVFTVRGVQLGVAAVKGFGGGFPSAVVHEFGEPQMKAFVAHSRESAEALAAALAGLEADVRVALTHYSPAESTLAGEERRLYSVLGSEMLGKVIDDAGADLAVHGHAHNGTERGATPGGVPVRNVARQVLQAPYRLYTIAANASGWMLVDPEAPPSGVEGFGAP